MPGDEQIGRLQVRSRQVVSGAGGSVTEFTVYCPFRQRSVGIDECEECAAYDGTQDNADGEPIAIACTRLAAPREMPDVVEEVARGALERTPVSRIMARHVICVQADMPLQAVADLLVRRRISGVPVIDDEFRPLGMISKTDLIRRASAAGGEHADGEDLGGDIPPLEGLVGGFMTPSVASLGERASVLEAAAIMADRHVHRLPVVGRDGRIVGMVSSLDVLAWISRDLPQGEGVAGAT
jgi:CBS domain-containing protein